jgi:Glycosyl hydrolase family 10/PA14 domain/Calx-beta domain
MSKQNRKHRIFGLESLESRYLLALDTVAGIGVTAQYFNDTELQTLFTNRLETALTQDWGNGVPVSGLNADQFSARFLGQIEATFTEPHTFALNADGGVRLWINGRKAIDRWSDSSVTNATTTVEFVSGRKYDLQLEFIETGGAAGFDLTWSSPSLPSQSLPNTRLFPSERGLIERRLWSSLAGNGVTALTSLSTYPNSPSSVSSLTSLEVSSTGSNQYGELLVGNLHPTTTGDYRFYIAADDSAELWLSNSADLSNKQRIAFVTSPTASRDWTAASSQQSALISLVAGQAYAFEAIHKEDSDSDHVAVGWQQPGSGSITVIDGQYLSPPLPTVRAFSQNASTAEGQSTPMSFVVQREGSPLTNPLVVHYALRGTATAGLDYTPVTGTVTIPAGATSATVSLTTLSDALTEGSETVIFEIVDGPGYQVGLISERRSLGTIQDVRPMPAGGVRITPVSTLANSTRFGGTFQSVTVSPYTNVIQAAITTQPANSYNSQLKFNYNAAVQAGDLLWAEFTVRAIGTEGLITVISELTTSPFTKSVDRSFAIPTEWTRIQIPFASVGATAAGAAAFGFFLGSKIQTLQFADVSVWNFGPSRELTPTTYSLNNFGGDFGNSSTVNITGQPFTSAVRINTVTAPDQSFKLQYVGRNSQKVATTSNIRLEYYARSISGANPRIGAVIQQASGSFTTLSSTQHFVTPAWTKYTLNATTTAAFDVNGLQVALNVGFTPQSVEIADIKWTNLSAAVSLGDLPSTGSPTTYAGRSGTDAWRESADTRIDDVRKASLTVNVTDPLGKPINGAVVSIQQKRHAFRFGSAIDGQNQLLSPTGGVTATKYQSEIKRLFNAATIENSLKWPFYIGNEAQALEIANWVVANNIHLRGHTIVWPSRRNMPTSVWTQYDSIKASQGDVAAADYLRTTVQSRVQTAVTAFQGLAGEWDVVNEPFDNNDVMAILGDSVVNDWFNQVRTLSPNTERVLNDYDIFARNGNNAPPTKVQNFLSANVASILRKKGEVDPVDDPNLLLLDHHMVD